MLLLATASFVGPALAALALGAALLVRGARRFRRTRRTAAWRETAGVIVASGLTPPMLRPAPPRRLPAVRYRYTVDGHTYEAWFEHTRVEYDDPDAAAQLAAQYPLGRALRIWYDPTAPAHAIAVGDFPFRGRASLVAGVSLLGLGLWLGARALGAI